MDLHRLLIRLFGVKLVIMEPLARSSAHQTVFNLFAVLADIACRVKNVFQEVIMGLLPLMIEQFGVRMDFMDQVAHFLVRRHAWSLTVQRMGIAWALDLL